MFRFLKNRKSSRTRINRRNARRGHRLRAFETLEDRRMLAVFVVDDLTDGGSLSLREAIDLANSNGVEDTIQLVGSPHVLSITGSGEDAAATGDLDIRNDAAGHDLTIVGEGAGSTLIDASSLGDRVFHILTGASVSLEKVMIAGGSSSLGGGIAVDAGSSLNVADSDVLNNSSTGKGGGIAVDMDSSLTVSNSDVSSNSSGNLGGGIAVAAGSSVTVSNSEVLENFGASGGGGIYSREATLTVQDSLLMLNDSNGNGGGIYNDRGMADVKRSTFADNTAVDNGAGIVTFFQTTGSLSVDSSTFARNIAQSEGGGIFVHSGTAEVNSSTFSANSATFGGAISANGPLTLTSSTLFKNFATSAGGGIHRGSISTIHVGNTIIAGNTVDMLATKPDISGAFFSDGFNLIGDPTGGSGFTGTADQVGTETSPIDPLLEPMLADNGGPTETHALTLGSPALDAGSDLVGDGVDQREFPRPAGAASDIGAFELQVPTNNPPTVAHPIADIEANEDDPNDVIDVSNVFADADAADMLTLSVSNTNSTLVTASIVGDDLVLDYQSDQSGTSEITVRATDLGGLFAEDTFTVTVLSAQQQLDDVIDDVGDLGLTGGNANALVSKLTNAIDKLDQGNTSAGVNKIFSFINQVNAFVNSGKLTQAEADVLIAAANAAIASAGEGGAALVTHVSSGGSSAVVQPISEAALLVTDTLTVALADGDGGLGAEHQARLQDAISELNEKLGVYGIALIEIDGQNTNDPDITITVAPNSACGGAADGVLGCTEGAGRITLISDWNFYNGSDVGAIGTDQYDFQTIVTHELGHSIGFDHSGDVDSVMYELLAANETRRVLTAQDLVLLEHEAAEGPAALLAAPFPDPNAKVRQDAVAAVFADFAFAGGRAVQSVAAGSCVFASDFRAKLDTGKQNGWSPIQPADDNLPVYGHEYRRAVHIRASGASRIDGFLWDDFLPEVGVDDLSLGGHGHDAVIEPIVCDSVDVRAKDS